MHVSTVCKFKDAFIIPIIKKVGLNPTFCHPISNFPVQYFDAAAAACCTSTYEVSELHRPPAVTSVWFLVTCTV